MPLITKKKRRIANTGPIDIKCEFVLDDGDLKAADGKPGPKKFKIVANTGKPMRATGFGHPVVLDQAGVRFDKKKTPVIADHDTMKRIGHTTTQGTTPKVTAEGVISSTSQHAQEFIADSKNGFPFQVSVGANIEKASMIEEGETRVVNGRRVKGPAIHAERSVIRELSVLVLGADNDTSVKITARSKGDNMSTTRKTKIAEDFKKHLAKKGLDSTDLTASALTKLEKAFRAGPEDDDDNDIAPTTEDDKDEPKTEEEKRRLKAAAEDDRIETIQDSASSLIAEYSLGGDDKKLIRTIRSKAIKEGWSTEKAELEMIRKARPTVPSQHSGHVENDIDAKAMECALVRQLGLTASTTNAVTGEQYGSEHWYPKEVLEASHAKSYKDVCLHSLMDMNIRANGKEYHGSRKSQEYVETFLRANASLKAASGGFSTLAVSNILENVANKMLLQAYTAQEVVWRDLVAVKNLSDFKTHSFYRLTTTGGYEKVGADGELKHGSFSDQKYTLAADIYGMILSLTLKDMMNDDLSAFDQIPGQLGRLSSLALEFAVIEMITSNANSYFAAGNDNLLGAVDFDIEGLTLGVDKFMNQTNDGKPILVSPDRVLVGVQDAVLAREIFAERNIDVTTASNKKITKRNEHVGKFQPIVSPVLSNADVLQMDGSAFTTQNANHWYMGCNPQVLAGFHVGFVNGQAVPVIQSSDTSFETLGLKWRSYHMWGTGEASAEAWVKSPGA